MKIKKLNEAIEPQNTMKIMPLSGLNADGFTVIILDSEGNELFNKEYRYGVDASYDRRFAKWAEDDYNNAKKYGWKTPRALKPYVADIIDELCSKYGIDKNSIEFVAGKNMFSGGNVTDDFVSRMRQRVYESKSMNENWSVLEFFTMLGRSTVIGDYARVLINELDDSSIRILDYYQTAKYCDFVVDQHGDTVKYRVHQGGEITIKESKSSTSKKAKSIKEGCEHLEDIVNKQFPLAYKKLGRASVEEYIEYFYDVLSPDEIQLLCDQENVPIASFETAVEDCYASYMNESKSRASKKAKLAEDINDPDEVLDFRRNIEAAESAEEIEELIVALSDGVAEDVIRTEFNLHRDADLEEIKDAVLCELDLYLDDNTWLGESKKMKKLGSGAKKLNESSYDGPYGAYDVKRLVSGRGPQDWWVLKEIEMDFGDGAKVAAYLKKKGIKVEFNADDETWFVRGQYHFTDCYFYPYAYGHEDEESLTEEARPSQSTLDDCLEYYLNNAFGYDGVEDYVDTEFPYHDNAFKAEVVNYIKEHKHLHEGVTQYGVHQFSTDSIIFRGTEQECGEYIDNNQKLWDDAEVYRMEPGDTHYKNVNEASGYNPRYEDYIEEVARRIADGEYDDNYEVCDYVANKFHKSIETVRDDINKLIYGAPQHDKMDEALSGYKLNITRGGKTFDDYCYAYSEDEAKRQMSNKYGKDVTFNSIEVRNKEIKEAKKVQFESEKYIGAEAAFDIRNDDWSDAEDIIEYDGQGAKIKSCAVDNDSFRDSYWDIVFDDGTEFGAISGYNLTLSKPVNENAQGEGKYSDIFHQYLEWLLDEGKEDNIGYLASQLIRYCPEEDLKDLWHDRMEKVAGTVGYTLTESLTEDVEVPVLSGPEEGPKSGVAALINEAIQEELKTVQMYNDIAVTARAEGFEEIAGQIDEINTEENKHIGQLQEVLKTVAPNAQAIDAGELEAGDTIINVEEGTNNSNNTPNNNIEEDVSMKKERWEDIYNSFKAVEKELNQDGEAVTAVVDKMYQDNKDDPDYKKAYDKWASGE